MLPIWALFNVHAMCLQSLKHGLRHKHSSYQFTNSACKADKSLQLLICLWSWSVFLQINILWHRAFAKCRLLSSFCLYRILANKHTLLRQPAVAYVLSCCLPYTFSSRPYCTLRQSPQQLWTQRQLLPPLAKKLVAWLQKHGTTSAPALPAALHGLLFT